MKLQVKYRPIGELIPYVRNSRTHSDEQVAQIAASIKEFGFTNPVLVDGDKGIIAGHGRILASRKLGLKDVPTIELAHLTEAQRRAYVIADNKLAENAGWDMDLLKIEVADLDAMEFDLTLLGFSTDVLAGLLVNATATGNTDPDDVPEPPADPVSALGDVWVLGNHRITCGDCTDALVVERLLGAVKPHLMVTDPPYGVEYDAGWRSEAGKTSKAMKTKPHHVHAKGAVTNDDKADWRDAWALFPGDVAYVWHASLKSHLVAESLEACGFELRASIIWSKNQITVGRGHYQWQHEPCWYVVKSKGGVGHWHGDRKQSTIWNIDKPKKSETGHSTQKPVECMKRPIENNSSPGQAVYEPFSGSGTTIIAGEMTGRSVYAIELNPAYVDVAIKRWQDFTGQEATLEGDGRTFADVTKARCEG